MKKKLQFQIFPRLHLTLIGMNYRGYRINGGIGFAIDSPWFTITISKAEAFSLEDSRIHSLTLVEIERIEKVLERIVKASGLKFNIKAQIQGNTPTHFGFGTGTAIRLALIEGLLLLNNRTYENEEIVKLSGRGKTSGIGVRTYFEGGYVIDLGHPNVDEKIMPSNQREDVKTESLLLKKG